MKNILIFCTRSLCYFSGEFFARELAEIFKNKGDSVETVILPDEAGSTSDSRDLSQFAILEKYIGKSYDAVIDFNSFLPYLTDEDGTPILDEIDSPFYNYLLDHPLYHHPGLSYELKNYDVICIDKKHADYVRKYYPHIKKILYKPLPGAKIPSDVNGGRNVNGSRNIDIRDGHLAGGKSNRLFFSGTFMSENELMEELDRRPEIIRKAVLEIAETWDPEKTPVEDAVQDYLQALNPEKRNKIYSSVLEQEKNHMPAGNCKAYDEHAIFPLLMNHMYSLDRIMRYRLRANIIRALAQAGIELDIQGEGWDRCCVSDNQQMGMKTSALDESGADPEIRNGANDSVISLPNVHYIYPAPMEDSIFEIARHKYILDINPLFFEGLHDRVSTAFVNGCVVFSNMNPLTVPEEYKEKFHHYSANETELLIQSLRDQGL